MVEKRRYSHQIALIRFYPAIGKCGVDIQFGKAAYIICINKLRMGHRQVSCRIWVGFAGSFKGIQSKTHRPITYSMAVYINTGADQCQRIVMQELSFLFQNPVALGALGGQKTMFLIKGFFICRRIQCTPPSTGSRLCVYIGLHYYSAAVWIHTKYRLQIVI